MIMERHISTPSSSRNDSDISCCCLNKWNESEFFKIALLLLIRLQFVRNSAVQFVGSVGAISGRFLTEAFLVRSGSDC